MKWKFWQTDGAYRFVLEIPKARVSEALERADIVTKHCFENTVAGKAPIHDVLCGLWFLSEILHEADKKHKSKNEPEIDVEVLSDGRRITPCPLTESEVGDETL